MSSPSTRTWRWSFLRSSHSFCMWLCHPPIKSKVYPLPPPHTHTHTHISKFCCIGLCFLWLRECDGSDVLRLVSLGSKKARLIVTLKLYKVWGNLGERYTELLVLFLQIFYKVRNFFKIRGVKWKDFFFFFFKGRPFCTLMPKEPRPPEAVTLWGPSQPHWEAMWRELEGERTSDAFGFFCLFPFCIWKNSFLL